MNIGSLPKDAESVIKILDVKIPLYKIAVWFDSGTEGMIAWGDMSDGRPDGLAIFDRDENIYGIIDVSKISEADEEKMEEKFQKLGAMFEKLGPMLQEKMMEAFPEIANLL